MKNIKGLTVLLTGVMAVSMSLTAFAGQWMKDDVGYWWQEDDGSYPTNTMKWINADGDLEVEGYYFDENGYVYRCTYTGNETGAWTLEEWMETQLPQNTGGTEVRHNEGYDPAHPLAGKIDEWNLRLPEAYTGFSVVASESVQARLTGQMDYYNYLDIANYATLQDGIYIAERNGSTFYVSEEDYKATKDREEILYNWFCNWLNSFDFENMTEVQRANEISKLLKTKTYDDASEYTANIHSEPYQEYYAVLIADSGVCRDFAITACALARSLGLRSTVSSLERLDHMNYYIEVDDVVYVGSNGVFNMTGKCDNSAIIATLH